MILVISCTTTSSLADERASIHQDQVGRYATLENCWAINVSSKGERFVMTASHINSPPCQPQKEPILEYQLTFESDSIAIGEATDHQETFRVQFSKNGLAILDNSYFSAKDVLFLKMEPYFPVYAKQVCKGVDDALDSTCRKLAYENAVQKATSLCESAVVPVAVHSMNCTVWSLTPYCVYSAEFRCNL